MLKNRTLIGIVLIVAAIGLCFGISPLFNTILASKTTIIRLKQDIPQGVQITGSMLEAVEVGTMNLPADMQNDPKKIIGKYSVTAMFAGDSFNDKKLSDTIDTSDSLLRQLKPNETAMSVTVKSLANGLSGKLQQGDIIQIVSVDEDDKAQIFEELQYVEVLATTSDKGSDNTYNDGEVNANAEDEEDQSLYATVTIILQDRAQALRLAECENTSLHAIFVCRGDEEYKQKCLKAQLDLLTGGADETAEATSEADTEILITLLQEVRKQLMAHKIIAVYGNSGSYKTTTALSLARYMASKGTNIILVGADTTKPLLPIAAPLESKFAGSLGKALSSVDFDRDMILKNIYMATDHVGILSYNIRENANTYAVVSQDRIDDLYMQLRQQSDTDIIVDCTSDISQSKLTAKAIITADVVIELLTCDTNGLVFDGSQEPILQSEQYTYRKFVRMMSLSSVFKQDEAAMKNAMGRISGTIPYCPKAAEYLNQGTLLTKGVDDRTYNTTIKSLAEIIMKEE